MSRFPRQPLVISLLAALSSAACGAPPPGAADAGPPQDTGAASREDGGSPPGEDAGEDAGSRPRCADGSDPMRWYLDCDGDDYGHLGEGIEGCEAPAFVTAPPEEEAFGSFPEYRAAYRSWAGEECLAWGIEIRTDDLDPGAVAFVLAGGDCDESMAAVHPGSQEVCDSRDNDCDLAIDEGEGGAPIHPYCTSDFEGICDRHPSRLVEREGQSRGYFFCTGRLGWEEAEALCRRVEGGHLLRLRQGTGAELAEDMGWLRSGVGARIRVGQPVWIGLRDHGAVDPGGSSCAHDLRWVGEGSGLDPAFDPAGPYWGAAAGDAPPEPEGCGEAVAFNLGRLAVDGETGALVDAPAEQAFTFVCERPL